MAVRIDAATATIAFLGPRRALMRWYWAWRWLPLVRAAAHAHWTSVVLSQGEPLRMRLERRLPALSSLRGQMQAHETRLASVAKKDGLFKQLKKALIERALGAELTEHLGYEKGDPAGRGSGNSRNGTSSKTVLTEDGEIAISVPRDRAGSFEPQLIGKGQTRFDGFDDKILSLYARGMTVREIQGHCRAILRGLGA